MKLTQETLARISEAAEEIDYGRIVIEFNETMPDVLIKIERIERYRRGDLPRVQSSARFRKALRVASPSRPESLRNARDELGHDGRAPNRL